MLICVLSVPLSVKLYANDLVGSSGGPSVWVSATQKGDLKQAAISQLGPGIDNPVCARIWEVHQQMEDSFLPASFCL